MPSSKSFLRLNQLKKLIHPIHISIHGLEVLTSTSREWPDRKLYKIMVSRICQIETDTISRFPKPQVACSIHAGSAVKTPIK